QFCLRQRPLDVVYFHLELSHPRQLSREFVIVFGEYLAVLCDLSQRSRHLREICPFYYGSFAFEFRDVPLEVNEPLVQRKAPAVTSNSILFAGCHNWSPLCLAFPAR